jgi:hypothetical protein
MVDKAIDLLYIFTRQSRISYYEIAGVRPPQR